MKHPSFLRVFACLGEFSATSGAAARRKRPILSTSIVPLAVLIGSAISPFARADAIFTPSDPIRGGQETTPDFVFTVGVTPGAAGVNSWPGGEAPLSAIDGIALKYLNFGETFTGFLVNPSFNGGNGSVVSSMQLWTANDAAARDPSSYKIWGTNVNLDFGQAAFDLTQFTLISSGMLSLPDGRGPGGNNPLNNVLSQTVTFSNNQDYKRYLITFPTVKDAAGANSMQIAEVQLFGIAAFTSLKWTGANGVAWNINTTQNWSTSGSPSTFSNTNGVTFDDSATPANTNISIQTGGAGVAPATVFFQNNTLNYTFSGDAINSPGSLTLTGTGTVTLNNANNYTLGAIVNAGSLIIGAAGSLGASTLALNNPNTADGTAVTVTFNSAQSIGSLSGTIATPATGTNTATITLNGNLTINQGADSAFAGSINGTGSLIKSGAGALALTGVSNHAGPTVINEGILNSAAPGDNPQGALPAGQPITVNSNGALLFGADDGLGYREGSVSSLSINGGIVVSGANTHSTLPALTMNGGTLTSVGGGNFSNGSVLNYILDGDVTTVASATSSAIDASAILLRKDPANTGTAPVTFNVPRGTATVDLSVSAIVRDQGAGLIKQGDGILALTNRNEYTGPTTVTGGAIVVTNSAALGTGAVSLSNGTVLALGATDNLNGFTGFSLNGGATADATNSVLSLTENLGNQARSAFSTDLVSIENGFTTSFVYTAGGARQADGFTFTIQSTDPTAIGGGGGQLGYQGIANSASIQFNIYTGGGQPIGTNYAVGTTGLYVASDPVNLGSGNPIAISLTYDPTAQTITEVLFDQLTRASQTQVFTGVDLTPILGDSVGFVGFTGATGGLAASQSINNFRFNNFAQGVSLPNNISIADSSTIGLQVLPLGSGGTGSASLQGTLAIGSNATVNVTGGPTVTDTPFLLNVTSPSTLGGDVTINVANNGTGTGSTILGAIMELVAGSDLTKTGAGSLTISGAATYTGSTTVNAGTLRVNGSLAGTTTFINAGATLAGSGTVTEVVVAGTGTIAPGNGLGTINTGPLGLQSGSIFDLQIGATDSDQIKVNGNTTLTGTISLSLSLLANPTDDLTYTIIDGGSPLLGYASGARFSYLGVGLDEGATFTVDNGGFIQDFTISYLADGGRDVTLFAVPEPGSAALLLGSALLTLGLRRRRS